MRDRFSERARNVVELARQEARTLRNDHVGTEHLLLGLVREEQGLAARVLESLGVSVERVHAGMVGKVASGENAPEGEIPLTPRASRVLELSLEEAHALGQNLVDTQHILLSLASENAGVAMGILFELGLDAKRIHDEGIRMAPKGSPGPLA